LTGRRARWLIAALVSAAFAVWLVVPWVVWWLRDRRSTARRRDHDHVW
jgi:hypothetical protein